jgi:hypothetical protein
MKHCLVVIVSLALFACTAQAQTTGLTPNKQYQLQPLKDSLAAGVKGKACGGYFLLEGQPVYPNGKVGVVAFAYTEEGAEKTESVVVMGYDKLITVIDDKIQNPTATFSGRTPKDDPIPFHWTIRLSKKALAIAKPCLPDPSAKPEDRKKSDRPTTPSTSTFWTRRYGSFSYSTDGHYWYNKSNGSKGFCSA